MKTSIILHEISTLLERLAPDRMARLVDAILESSSIFAMGAGRSGLLARCFAMRLRHLGLDAHIVGDTLAPPADAASLALAVSGSGETPGIVALAERARDCNATIALVTAAPHSRLAELASIVVTLDAPSTRANPTAIVPSVQPLGSLFEQGAFLFFEATVLELMRRLGVTATDMAARHANIE